MTNTEALKAVYTALGGSAEGGDTNAEILNAIYTVLGGEADTSGMTNAELIEAVSTVATGGGGSSDFKTYKVTFTNTLEDIVPIRIGVFAFESSGQLHAGEMAIPPLETFEADAVIYKDQPNSVETITPSVGMEATGAAEVVNNICTITGACSITFKAGGK